MQVYPCGDLRRLFLDGWLHGIGNLPPIVMPLGVRSIQYLMKPSPAADGLSIWEAVFPWYIGYMMMNDCAGLGRRTVRYG